VVEQSRRAAMSDSDVLILGESGSGKEVLARAIHFNSGRKKGPFVAVNCGAIPETLLESELFGHERGAFTGAVNRRAGCFEQAHNGTLFLDEIGEMRPDMQVRLLRALENREIRRVGGDKTIKVNTRVISATNQDIGSQIKVNAFRTDLYYRLAILVLEIPPLRERTPDVLPLAQYFLDEARKEGHTRATGFTPEAREALARYGWPGNVRELRNAIERAVVFEDGVLISLATLPQDIIRNAAGPQTPAVLPKLTETYTAEQFRVLLNGGASSAPGAGAVLTSAPSAVQAQPSAASVPPVLPAAPAATAMNAPATPGVLNDPLNNNPYANMITPAVMRGPNDGEVLSLDEEEKRIILRTLSITGGNISDAARRLGVHRSTLHRKMARYGLATDEQFAADTVKDAEA